VPIAQELGCSTIIVPKTASAMSACGMQFSDIVFEQTRSRFTLSGSFDIDGVNRLLEEIDAELERFRRTLRGAAKAGARKEFFAEARYKSQVWELDTPLPVKTFRNAADVAKLVEAFHAVHDRVYAVRDEASEIECVNWRGRIAIGLGAKPQPNGKRGSTRKPKPSSSRSAYFGQSKDSRTPVFRGLDLKPGDTIVGPAIVEEPTTTIVVYPKTTARVSASGHYIVTA
jgi:N-methylhydantoinase A